MPSTAWISDRTSDWKARKNIYGGGIWAPSFRYHDGTYYIFANVNRFGLQVYRASDPRGPWKHNRIEQGLHDLSVLFDDDGKIYAVYGARTIRIVELNRDLTALVPGTDRVLIEPAQGMGEGSHVYRDQGQILHRQRDSGSARSHEVRPGRQTRGAVGGDHDQRRREPGNRPGLQTEG